MASRPMELERRTLLVQFIAVEPLTFYATSDGTDLVQGILRSHLGKPDANILGQEGSLSIDDNGEFLSFEPSDTKNRALHLPIEHLAYCGALRRMRREPSDERNPDQILKRDFENVDLANRYAQYIIGPPIFVAVFHGFDNALCYTFVTQSADDACLLVMKLMRTFRRYEQQLQEQQGQTNQGFSSNIQDNNAGLPSPVIVNQGDPLPHPSQALFTDNRQILSSPPIIQMPSIASNMYTQNPYQDDFVQNLLSNPNFHIVNQPYSSSAPIITQHMDASPFMSAPPPPMYYSTMGSPSNIVTQQNSSVVPTMLPFQNNNTQLGGGSSLINMQPPSPPIIGGYGAGLAHSLSMGNTLPPQVIHKPNNQEITYKQNIIIRWLKPPTPPPPGPIIIREIQYPPVAQPPIICRQMPPRSLTPPPIIVREQPPRCPVPQQPLIIEKRLPPPCLPRQVIVQRCPPPPPKPQQIIYEKYLPQPPVQRQIIVQRQTCAPAVCAPVPQQCTTVCAPAPQQCTTVCAPAPQPMACRRLVREIIRQVPQQCAPVQQAVVCTPQQQQQIIQAPPQVVQQLTPVYAQRQHVVQPKGIRVIRQVIGPAQSSMGQVAFGAAQSPSIGQFGIQQQSPFGCPSNGRSFI